MPAKGWVTNGGAYAPHPQNIHKNKAILTFLVFDIGVFINFRFFTPNSKKAISIRLKNVRPKFDGVPLYHQFSTLFLRL
jgi:hypothetical protein